MSSSDPDDAAILPVPAALPTDDTAAAPKRRPRRRKPEASEASEAIAAPVEEASAEVVDPVEVVAPMPPVVVPLAQAEPMAQAEDDYDEDEEEPDEEEDDLDRARRAAEREQRNAPPTQPIRFADVVSGQFDADEDSPEVPPLKRVLLPEADSPKLHKVLAQSGLGSRLEMEALIVQGRISVNN
ncbi:MAG: 23S rRNA pseudouridylate synthase B, partial [Variovorax sp.]